MSNEQTNDGYHELSEEQLKILRDFQQKFLDGLKPIPPEFEEVFLNNIEDLLAD